MSRAAAAVSTQIRRQTIFRNSFVLTLFCCWIASFAVAQNSADPAAPATVAKPDAAAQKIPPVTTTVVVRAKEDEYLSDGVTVGNLDGVPLEETPVSAMVVTRELLNDQGARLLSDVVKNDASIGEDYAPVGYYGDYEIRGYPIDLATGLEINGMTIAGEQDVPLENKERVEFLKGIAGVESGVAAPGGLINFVTKRPAAIEAVDLATDHRGSSYGAVDLGHLFGRQKQVGARVNLAGERIMSYVSDADGWRGVGAGAADWKITPQAILKGDFEYQHKVERSVCGYQLLGGESALDEPTLPNINELYPSTMPGEQSWTKPNTFDVTNSSTRLDYDLHHGWKAFAAASYSHALMDDNTIYPYGTSMAYDSSDDSYDIPNCPNAPDASSHLFCPDGTYGISDYRDPGELRIDAQGEALVTGRVRTGFMEHELTGGGEIFRRSVQQPHHSVNHYIGSENIYGPDIVYPIEIDSSTGKPDVPGPRQLDDDDHQSAGVMQDRVKIPGHIQLLVSGREDFLRDHNYSGVKASGDLNFAKKAIWLPQYAVTYNPVDALTLYGNYGVLLSLGIQAPWWTDNDDVYLDPYLTRQAEAGAKYELDRHILLTSAVFHMRAPFFYTKIIQAANSFCQVNLNTSGSTPGSYGPVEPNDSCFESAGHETHDGVEVNAEGKAASWLQLTASVAAIRAISDDTGTLAFNHKQVTNVPHLRTALFADVVVPHARGVHLMPGWSYTGRKEALGDDQVSVSGYNIFNLGARYSPGGEQGHLTLRLYADNITDKRYWKDTGTNYGDTFVHMGAPTTVRLSAHYTF